MPCLSTQAQGSGEWLFIGIAQTGLLIVLDNSDLPEILVSPPWRGKKKTALLRLDLVPLELAPKARWQPGERERLAATESARYFSTESLAQRMERKSGRVVLQELGFGDDVWLFRNYILPGKLDAARKSLSGSVALLPAQSRGNQQWLALHGSKISRTGASFRSTLKR